jgi:DNA invertase Pin-like site-specific DNA recombinase
VSDDFEPGKRGDGDQNVEMHADGDDVNVIIQETTTTTTTTTMMMMMMMMMMAGHRRQRTKGRASRRWSRPSQPA